jgi:hypothetical protein
MAKRSSGHRGSWDGRARGLRAPGGGADVRLASSGRFPLFVRYALASASGRVCRMAR